MKIALDFEFYDTGTIIPPISIGMVREDGEELYREFPSVYVPKDHWLWKNVMPHLGTIEEYRNRDEIKNDLLDFCGIAPEFYGWYCAYDFVILRQLWGPMIGPQALTDMEWPMFITDLRVFMESIPREGRAHHALDDAWNIAKAMKSVLRA